MRFFCIYWLVESVYGCEKGQTSFISTLSPLNEIEFSFQDTKSFLEIFYANISA